MQLINCQNVIPDQSVSLNRNVCILNGYDKKSRRPSVARKDLRINLDTSRVRASIRLSNNLRNNNKLASNFLYNERVRTLSLCITVKYIGKNIVWRDYFCVYENEFGFAMLLTYNYNINACGIVITVKFFLVFIAKVL